MSDAEYKMRWRGGRRAREKLMLSVEFCNSCLLNHGLAYVAPPARGVVGVTGVTKATSERPTKPSPRARRTGRSERNL